MIYVPTDKLLVEHIQSMIAQATRPQSIKEQMGSRQSAAYSATLLTLEAVLKVVKAHAEQNAKLNKE